MEKEFVPYELALRMKQLGFDEEYLAIYSNANPKTGLYTLKKYRLKLIKQASQKDKGVKAPTFSQAFRWFREKYDLHYCPFPKQHFPDNRINDIYYYEIFISDGEEIAFDDGTYIIGESLESTALEKLIEIVEISNQQINK
jgi:hypothetical protein